MSYAILSNITALNLTNVLETTIPAIPGTAIIVSSLIDGSTRAFLTLRAGIIAREYCRPLTKTEKKKAKRLAIKDSCQNAIFDLEREF